MRYCCSIPFIILTCSIGYSQPLWIGGLGGGMVSNDLGGPWLSSVSARYVIGPQLEIGLPFGLGIDAAALYRHERYQITFTTGYPEQYATSWEFPLLLKKSLSVPIIKPFVEAGWAARVLEETSYTSSTSSQGFVIGGGVQFGIGRLRLAPVIRYTRWNNTPVLLVIPNGPSPTLTPNQTDIALGISWKVR